MSARAVIAGPCISEFGWELMEWQGHIRRLAQTAEQVIVCTTDGLYPLYADMKPTFIPHRIQCARDAHRSLPCSIKNPQEDERVRAELLRYQAQLSAAGYAITRVDDSTGKIVRRPTAQQLFVHYGNPADAPRRYPLVIHARNRTDAGPWGGDNYPLDRWNQLLDLLIANKVIGSRAEVAAIGSSTAAFAPPGVVDMLGMPIAMVMNQMAAAQLVLGPSSGPMHLASLCGTPHFVWACGQRQAVISGNNRDRYLTYWNPFKTTAQVVLHSKGHPPRPEDLAGAITEFWHGLPRRS